MFSIILGWSILCKHYNENTCNLIKQFLEIVKDDPNTVEQCKLPSISDKNTRKYIHRVIREAFPSLVSDTDADCIVLHSCKDKSML